jgi:hypothetical protein
MVRFAVRAQKLFLLVSCASLAVCLVVAAPASAHRSLVQSDYPAGSDTAFGLATGDFNGDGIADLASATTMGDSVAVVLGNGDGTFGSPSLFGNVAGGYSIPSEDFNGDGAADLASAATNVVSVLLNSPAAGLSPAALNFGSAASPVPQGTASAPQTVTISNDGSAPLRVTGFAITGSDRGDFDTGAQTCGQPVAPGGSCQVRVRFFPQAEGNRQANLEILSNAATTPIIVSGVAGPLPTGPTGPKGDPGPYAAISKVRVSGQDRPSQDQAEETRQGEGEVRGEVG